MIVAYTTFTVDNGEHMWGEFQWMIGWGKPQPGRIPPPPNPPLPPPGVICAACGVRTDWMAVNPKFKPRRYHYDLSRCYDGDYLVSAALRTYLESQQLPGVRFVELATTKRLFVLQTDQTVRLRRRPPSHMEEYCEACGQYRSVYGAGRMFLEGVHEPIVNGLYFTDIKFAYYPQMGPRVVFGIKTWEGIVARRFKGLGQVEAIEH